MSSNRPTTGREVLKPGVDVRKIRGPINDAFSQSPREFVAEGGATYMDGGRVSLAMAGDGAFYIRLDSKDTGNTPIRYGWTAVNYDRTNGTWANSVIVGNSTDDGHAIELNNANLTVGTTTRYPARINPQSGRLTFFQTGGSGGGLVNITSGETVLMILGDYDTYKNCPNVPGSPPTLTDDYCNGTTNTTLCVPAYAYAVYQRCGYQWNKVGDTRDYQVWANELNGGSTSAWRRFHIPRWGGNLTSGAPLPDDACMGVAFIGSGASALTCSCPPCLSSPPEDSCLALKFRTIARPSSPAECASLITEMDTYSAWEKEFTIQLTGVGGWCSATGADPNNIFTVNWDWQDGASLDPCDWGPDTFDPCDPCWHWGRLLASITVPGGNDPNCGSPGHWTGEFRAKEVCDLLCDCGTGPISPIDQVFCQGCGNVTPPQFNVIEEGSIELVCCSPEMFAGLTRWFDPSEGLTLSAGPIVDDWVDQSSNAKTLSQSLIYRPNYQNSTDTINNMPTIGIDRIRWVGTTSTGSVINGANGFSMFTVHRYRPTRLPGNATTDGAVYSISGGRAAIGAYESNGSWIARGWYRKNGTESQYTVNGPTLAHNTVMLSELHVNYVAGYEAAKLVINDVTYNGTAPGNGTISASSQVERTGYADGFNLFLPTTNSNRALPSDTGDIILYNRTLSTAEATAVRRYLKGKYGL